jgi:hypothetical protein
VVTDQFQILGEGNIALNNTRAHASGGQVRFLGVLGEHETGTAVANGKVRRFVVGSVVHALAQLLLEGGVSHGIDQPKQARTKLPTHRRLRLIMDPWY